MLSIVIDLRRLGDSGAIDAEARHFVDWMKKCKPVAEDGDRKSTRLNSSHRT